MKAPSSNDLAGILAFSLLAAAPASAADDSTVVVLPEGVTAVWDTAKAVHESTPTRERISLNGLWRWQPGDAKSDEAPASNWGYFKVPGSWPGITDYMQKDSQSVFANPEWNNIRLGEITAAWYEREFTVPDDWAGRRIALTAEYLNSFATVFVDGKEVGEIHFPDGELDLSAVCRPGVKHRLSLLVVALPLKGVMLAYTDSASAREVTGTVARRGLCGDVFLVSAPPGPKLSEVTVDTSVRERELNISALIEDLAPNGSYRLHAQISRGGSTLKTMTSPAFQSGELADGRFAFGESWIPDRLWDLHTPENQFELQVSLIDSGGRTLDTGWPQRFGFREFWIDGRDFYLNGKRVFLSAVPLDNAQVGAALATYAAARESLERLKGFGINYVYTHNYGCEPGAHLSFAEILRAADDVGMLVGLTQPHFSHYEWTAPDADANNGYLRHAEFYARVAGNHPSVVMYPMSHNATGYSEDMNPGMMDGIQEGRDQWASRNVRMATRAEAIVRRIDARRIVYHHASGNLGVMHNSNFYPNFTPAQELDDWFGHWAAEGVKPAFTCEYGAPFTWDWTMYRGWYQGEREFGSAQVPWEFCLAEWNAQFLGDSAYQISEAEKRNLRWEAKQFRAGKVWHRWDYPNRVGSEQFDERYPVFAKYITDNWRAFRTWGVSGISPWEYGHFWKRRDGVDRSRKEFDVDWEQLQRPGFSPDFVEQRYERMDLAYERSDWIATPAAEALLRNNRPLLAYVAGKKGAFTSKDHNFLPGETVEKQIIVINSSRETVTCNASWSIDLAQPVTGEESVTIPAGDQARLPFEIKLPADLPPGGHTIHLKAKFSTGETQEDSFAIDVMPNPAPVNAGSAKIALFDPAGETRALLNRLGVGAESIKADADPAGYDVLIIGKAALSIDGPAPDITRVRDGLKVIVFEQSSDVLEQRLGFRVAEYGLRRVFPRVSDHPILAGVESDNLRDWRGSATILPPQLNYEMRPRYGPTVEWAGMLVPRVWRCGNRGAVASVLIEKPARGDFLPLIDGGFSLQYSPLMEYREGKGMVLFCQLDVTGRTEADPAAAAIVRNIIRHAGEWKPAPRRQAIYVGAAEGSSFLESLGVTPQPYSGGLSNNAVLIVGPGGAQTMAPDAMKVAGFVQTGGRVLAIGLKQEEANAFLPFQITTRTAEHISSWFESPSANSLLAGIGPANVHNRDPRELPLLTSGAETVGDGVLGQGVEANVVFLQMPPWAFSRDQSFRRTFRGTAVLLNRLLGNLGVQGATPLLERLGKPVEPNVESRWLEGFYLDQPEEWDDPYRFFRW